MPYTFTLVILSIWLATTSCFAFSLLPSKIPMRTSSTFRKLQIMNLVDDDDDGWGDVKLDTNDSITDVTSSSSSDKILQNKELARLQDDRARKQNTQFQSSGANNSGERDLFIPIVSLVSVIGFSSLYGYEMLRLYNRGELYLPWEQ